MKLIEASTDSAVVELTGAEQFLLRDGLHEAMDLMEYWNEFVEHTGYEGHSFHYLYDWLAAHNPERLADPVMLRRSEMAAKRANDAPAEDKSFAAQVKVGGGELPDQFSFTHDAFRIFESAIREVLEEGAEDDFDDLLSRRVEVDKLQEIRRQILDVLAAIDTFDAGPNTGNTQQ